MTPGPELLPGDLVWTRSDSVIGWLIRFGERVKYHGWWAAIRRAVATLVRREIPEDPADLAWGNHIAVYVGDGQVIEALAGGLTLSPLSKYPPGSFRVLPLAGARPEVSDAERAAAVNFARCELARRVAYGWLGIASIIVQLCTPAKLSVSWGSAMICSAFGARCWEHAGVVLPGATPFDEMPSDLALLALAA